MALATKSITDVSVSTQWTLSFRCNARGILVASCTHTTCSLLAIPDGALRSAKHHPYLSEPYGSITRGARHGPAVRARRDPRPSIRGRRPRRRRAQVDLVVSRFALGRRAHVSLPQRAPDGGSYGCRDCQRNWLRRNLKSCSRADEPRVPLAPRGTTVIHSGDGSCDRSRGPQAIRPAGVRCPRRRHDVDHGLARRSAGALPSARRWRAPDERRAGRANPARRAPASRVGPPPGGGRGGPTPP